MTNLANAIALTAMHTMHIEAARKPLSRLDFLGLFVMAPAELIRSYS